MRKDARRNREILISAAEAVLRRSPNSVTMALVAKEAGLSTATAYRYFPTLDDLLTTFLREIIVRLRDFSHDRTTRGHGLYEEVVGEWIRLVETHGCGMVQVRSRRGYLERLRHHDPVITAVREAWERPVRAVMRRDGVPDQEFEFALFLHNLIFDPREILDLLAYGLDEEAVRMRLTFAYYGALRGWSEASGD